MWNNVKSIKMWENNNDTPMSASNLSRLVDFQSRGKFIHLTNESVDIEKWADFVISKENFPIDIDDNQLNSIVYNKQTGTAKKAVYEISTSSEKWEPSRDSNDYSMTNRILKISKDVQISMYYTDADSKERVYLNFDLGKEDQVISFDDIVRREEEFSAYNVNTTYSIYLIHKWSDGDNAYFKIIRKDDEANDFWYNISNNMSPTNSEVIAYRKVGGFKTNSDAEIIEDSIWDLFTYKGESTVDKINIFEGGFSREINSSDIKIENRLDQFNSDNIEGALVETRQLVDNIRNQFYTNRRFGVNVRYTPFVKENDDTLSEAGVNTLSLLISPGIIDVLNAQKEIDEPVFLNKQGVGLKIKDDRDIHNGVTVFNKDERVTLGTGQGQLKPGLWRILLDPSPAITDGNIILVHEEAPKPKLDLKTQAWFDEAGNRSIGKFEVKQSSTEGIYYIEKMSVTDTFDINVVPNTIHIHHGTLVPDGLLLCDGRWHDVMGIDDNTYTYQELLAVKEGDWGDSWYEETPNMYDKFMKMPPEEVAYNMNLGEKFILPVGEDGTTRGGSKDCGRDGGTTTHSHELPHSHDSGSLNISSSGSHPGHTINFTGSSDPILVTPVDAGTAVAADDHSHNTTVLGGDHYHGEDDINGEVGRLEGDDAITTDTTLLPPYKEILICIKK